MKPLLVFLTTSLVLAASAALAQQDGCSKQYGACMDHCSSRPQSVQGTCAQTCETNTNQCYVGVYGRAPANNAAAIAQPARDAQGKAEPAPEPASK
jgi:hypothetical protein